MDAKRPTAFTLIELFDPDGIDTRDELPVVRQRERKAFTLIELLVVVAIISLLVSILLPSLGRAKELARRSVCASTLRSLGLSLQIYSSDDAEEAYPPCGVSWEWNSDGQGYRGHPSVVGWLIEHLYDNECLKTWQMLWGCPSASANGLDAPETQYTGGFFSAGSYCHYSYFANSRPFYTATQFDMWDRKFRGPADPPALPLMMDWTYFRTDTGGLYYANHTGYGENNVHGANVMFNDIHVEWLTDSGLTLKPIDSVFNYYLPDIPKP